MEEVIITFNGTMGGTYYVPIDQVQYLTSDLYNTSSQTITLYSDKTSHAVTLQIPACSYPRYRQTAQATYSYVLDARDIRYSSNAYFVRDKPIIEMVSLSIFVFVCLARLFK